MAGLEVPGNARAEGCATLGLCDRNYRRCQSCLEAEGLLLHSAMYRAEVRANGHGLHEMWTTYTLCQFFERKTISNKVFTLMQFYGLRMKKGARISEHLRRLDELADQLTAIGEEVKEIHKVAVLLRSVQDHYPTLVTALLARGDEELTMTLVKQSLLDEEQRQEKGGYSESGSQELKEDSALRAGRGKFHRRPGKPGNCYKCGKSGHFARNCNTQSAQGDQSDRTTHRAKKAEEAQEETESDGAQESSYVVSIIANF